MAEAVRARSVGSRLAVPAGRLARSLGLVPRSLVLVLLAVYAVSLAVRMVALVAFPYPSEYTEGAILAVSWRVARGLALYPELAAAPFAPAVYGPLYYAVLALGLMVTGHPVFWFGRALSTLAALGLLGLGYGLGRRLTGERLAGMAAAAVIAALPVFYAWAPRLRPDALAVALSLGGVWVLSDGKGWRRHVAGAALLLAALYVKPTALAASVAVLLYLTWRDCRRAPWVAISLVAGLALPLLALTVLTHGQVLAHLVTANAQPLLIERVSGSVGYLAAVYPLVVGLGLAWVLFAGLTGRLGPWEIYFLVALGVGIVAMTKLGADSNHLLEALVLGAVLSVCLVREAWRRWLTRWGGVRELTLLVIATQLLLFHHVPFLADSAGTPGGDDWVQGAQLVARVEGTPGEVFAEDAGWLLLAGRPVGIGDLFVASQLARAGRWDETGTVRALEEGRFGLLVAGADLAGPAALPGPQAERYTERMRSAIANAYQLEGTLAGQVLLRPREGPPDGR